ncbi:transcription termination/antitermination factor NusG [Candidatus Dojkabacteria bacterium]|uniref:Transcription termination/antitermination protein NusG n=1 Tax=Candidatus Dojkabacteria bacterium TaxID=2099670 RepID=A0A3M0YXN8_9BACT|nr:MAG: transcription termination/antitermination factor NusG [Candidatus Dojkabacteria bacterium]
MGREDIGLKWYIITCRAGKENSIVRFLRQAIKASGYENLIIDVVVPTQEKIVMVKGKKKKVEERILPGYILTRLIAQDSVLNLIRNIEGVTGFVSAGDGRPKEIDEKEVKAILAYTSIRQEPVYDVKFTPGMPVKINHGPFKDFIGQVESVNEQKGQVKVILQLFGKDTPVEFDLLEVSSISE